MIVVDSNVIVYLFLSSEQSKKAEQVLRKDSSWASPPLWRSEIRNVLTVYIRKRLLTLDAAQKIMEEAVNLMTGREFDVVSSQVLNLAAGSTCSAYDCEFVALARDLGVSLVTVDKKILSQFPDVAISLDQFVTV